MEVTPVHCLAVQVPRALVEPPARPLLACAGGPLCPKTLLLGANIQLYNAIFVFTIHWRAVFGVAHGPAPAGAASAGAATIGATGFSSAASSSLAFFAPHILPASDCE